MDEKRLFQLVGYVMASEYRANVIRFLGYDAKIPSDIAKNSNIRTNHISNVLSDLKKKNLVVCINEDARKGRLYKNTELGLEVLKYL